MKLLCFFNEAAPCCPLQPTVWTLWLKLLSVVSHLSPGTMGTLSSAVLNVTTQSSTPGRSLPRWRRNGATQASVSYEKSDFFFFFLLTIKTTRGKADRRLAARLCSRRETFVHQDATWHSEMDKRSSLGWSSFGHPHHGRLEKRHLRSSLLLAWLCSVVLIAVVNYEIIFQFVFKVQYISTHHKKTEEDGAGVNFSCCYTPYDLWPTSNRERLRCLPFHSNASYSTLAC